MNSVQEYGMNFNLLMKVNFNGFLVRGDSGFATPELYERLEANARLQSLAQVIADENLDGTSLDKRQVYYAEFLYLANAIKLQISMLAYNFNNWFRRLCFQKTEQPSRMETVRTHLVKIAAKLIRSGR